MGGSEAIGLPLLSLLGGYIFVSTCNVTRYWVSQFAGHRLYFASAIAGVVLTALARALILVSDRGAPQYYVDSVTGPLILFSALTLLLGGLGHIAERWQYILARPVRYSLVLSTLLIAAVFLAIEIDIGLVLRQSGTSGAISSIVLAIGLTILLAPTFPSRKPIDKELKGPKALFLRAMKPQVFSGRFAAWFAASFRLGLTATIVLAAALSWAAAADPVSDWWKTAVPIRNAGLFFLAFSLGALGWFPINTLVPKQNAKEYAVSQGYDDSLETLLWKAQRDDKLVEVDLDNRKVYIGWILEMPPNLGSPQSYIDLLPLISGVRNELDQRLELTTFYHSVYGTREGSITLEKRRQLASLFNKVVKVDCIVTASLFDPNAFVHFPAGGSGQNSGDNTAVNSPG